MKRMAFTIYEYGALKEAPKTFIEDLEGRGEGILAAIAEDVVGKKIEFEVREDGIYIEMPD